MGGGGVPLRFRRPNAALSDWFIMAFGESPVVGPLPTLWCRVAELSDRRLDQLQPNMS